MSANHTLGMIRVSAGDLLTLVVDDDTTPGKPKTVTVVALDDIDVSKEMADYYALIDRTSRELITANAITGFLTWLATRRLVRVPREARIPFGEMKRPSSRLQNEYRYTLNPEAFWEEKLLARYNQASFNVINHQGSFLTLMAGIDAPFELVAEIIDGNNESLGYLRLDVLSDNRHTLINDDDLERLRLALQADITMHIPDMLVMVRTVAIHNNPGYGVSRYKQHCDPLLTPDPVSSPTF